MATTDINLTEQVAGVLPIANGGTGNTSNAAASCTGNAVNVTGTVAAANGGTGQTSLTSLPLTTPAVSGYTETVVAVGTVTSTATLSISSGTLLWATLTSATACTFTMPTAAAGKSFVLVLRQPASGTPTTATFTGVKWSTSGAPTITATVGSADVLTFYCYDGTNWYGSYAQGYTY